MHFFTCQVSGWMGENSVLQEGVWEEMQGFLSASLFQVGVKELFLLRPKDPSWEEGKTWQYRSASSPRVNQRVIVKEANLFEKLKILNVKIQRFQESVSQGRGKTQENAEEVQNIIQKITEWHWESK